MKDKKTPLLEELEQGSWPSFVTEMKKAAKTNAGAADLLHMLEKSYEEKRCHWKHGEPVRVKGYGGGAVARYCNIPEEFPNVKEFHTLRVNQPAGFFYTADKLRKLADIWDTYGSGLFNMHGVTGDVLLLGTTTENLQPCVDELSELGFDLGGSGGALRTLNCCVGQARCEKACIDSMNIMHELTLHYQNKIHRPAWPYKFKIKISACANDCCAAGARSDLAVIGTWRDTLKIDMVAVKDYITNGFKIENVIRKCPTEALAWDQEKQELMLHAEDCNRCMNCINMMPKALSIGSDTGATLLIGAKAPVVKGAMLGWVLVPFVKMESPYTELKEVIDKITDWWAEHAKKRERIGESISRVGLANFLKAVGLKPLPQMVTAPRSNPYISWTAEEVEQNG